MSASPVVFQTKDKKGGLSDWVAVVPGKGVTSIAPASETKENAQSKLDDIIKALPQPTQEKPKVQESATPEAKEEKPKPGDFKADGLKSLSPARLAALREKIASAIASGNVTLDRALVMIFRDEVPLLDPNSYTLLAAGWELACEQWFVSGIVPAWLLIVLGNVQVCSALAQMSKPKKKLEEGKEGTQPNGEPNPTVSRQTSKQK